MSGILIMAKAPRPGQVNTRLEPLLEPEGCAALQRELIRHTARWAAMVAARVWLAYGPTGAGAELAELVPGSVRLFAQADGDLGRRLQHAVALVGREHSGPLAIVGTDAPLLGPAHAQAAWQALTDGHDACLVPALDGGYSMIALARASGMPFALPASAWGGPRVLALTLAALQDAGLSTVCLSPVSDLDTPADAATLLADPGCPPAIRAALQSQVPA